MKRGRIGRILMAAALTLSLGAGLAGCGGGTQSYTIGICQQMPHQALDSATQGFKDAVVDGLGAENVEFLEQNAQGDTTVCTTIVTDFVTKNVDLIMANATGALQAAANGTSTIPVLGTSVSDYSSALGLSDFNGVVGGNVSGCSDLSPLDQQAAIIPDLFPEARTVGLLYSSSEANSIYQVGVVRAYLEGQGLTCQDFSYSDANDIAAVSTAAAAACDVLYIPTDNNAATFAETINGAVLPTGTPIVGGDAGICAGCGVATLAIDYYDLGVATGKMAVKVLTGEAKIEELPIAYAENSTKLYNPVNCAELGIDTALLESKGYVAIGE